MNLSCTVDTSGLNRGIEHALRYSRRTPAELCNTCAAEVAISAKNHMPFVTPGVIDSELGTVVAPRIGKRGQPLNTKYARNRVLSGSVMGSSVPEVQLAILIIMARSNPRSNYNLRTNGRYLMPNPLKGVPRAIGEMKLAEMVNQMIKNRHRSGHFLQAGWIPAVRTLMAITSNRWRRNFFSGPPLEGLRQYYGADLGEARPANPGYYATCTIENYVGLEGQNGANFNQALMEHGLGPLQNAVDNEGRAQMEYYLMKSGQEDLKEGWDLAAA